MRRGSFIAAALAGLLLSGTAVAEINEDFERVFEVGPDREIRDIQTAVNRASPGDIVTVYPGTYDQYQSRPGIEVVEAVPSTVRVVPRSIVWDSARTPSSRDEQLAIERNIDGVERNIDNTDDQIIREIMQGEAGAWNRLDDILSGKSVTREVNNIINKGTGVVTGAIDDTIDDATDAVLDPIEDTIDGYVDSAVEAVQCNFVGAAMAAAAGAVSSLWGGGDATYGAQLAQWLTATSSNFCQGRQVALSAQQLKVQRRQRDLMRKMTQRNRYNDYQNIAYGIGRSNEALTTAGVPDIVWRDIYPEAYDALTLQAQRDFQKGEVRRQYDAGMISKATAGQSIQGVEELPGRAKDLMRAARKAPGALAVGQVGVQATMMNTEVQAMALSTQIAHNQVVEAHLDANNAAQRRAIEYRARMRRGLPGYEGDGGLGALMAEE